MPVTFEPAAPVGLGYAQGAAEQMAQGNQVQLQANAQAAQLQANNTRVQQASYDAQAEREQRAAMAQAQMAHQSEMQDRQVQNQLYLQEQSLTQAENIRLTRMRNAIADIQGNPALDDEMKNDLITQIRTQVSPLALRAARTQQQLHQEQLKQFLHQQAQMTTIANMNAEQRAARVANRATRTPGGAEVLVNDDGTFTQLRHEPRETAERPDPSELTMQQYLQHYHEIEKEVNRMHAGPNAPGGEMGPADRRAAIRAALEGAGLAPDATAHGQRLSTARAARLSRQPGVGAAGGTNEWEQGFSRLFDGESGPPPTAPTGAAPQPITGVPRSRWTPGQASRMQDFNLARHDIESITDPARRRELHMALNRAEDLYMAMPDTARMAPEVRQEYERLVRLIAAVPPSPAERARREAQRHREGQRQAPLIDPAMNPSMSMFPQGS